MGEVGELGPYFKSAEIQPVSDWMRFQLEKSYTTRVSMRAMKCNMLVCANTILTDC